MMHRRLAIVAAAIAISSGAGGALLTWVAVGRLRMSPGDWVQTLALIAVVVGWVVSYEMTLSAQALQTRNDTVNEARREVLAALRRQKKAINFAAVALGAFAVKLNDAQRQEFPARMGREVTDDLRAGGLSVDVLREYEQVFPRTRRVREELSKWQDSLYGDLYRFFTPNSVLEPPPSRGVEDANALLGRCWAILGFIDDLRLHIQDESLGEIMGVKATRTPLPGHLGRLRTDQDGNLRLPTAEEAAVDLAAYGPERGL